MDVANCNNDLPPFGEKIPTIFDHSKCLENDLENGLENGFKPQ